jgi:MFS transporter, DHA2 family, methylenomycin A resistance protein
MMLISGAVTPFSARIVERTGPRIPILTGLGLMAIGGIGLALLDPTTPTWILSALLVPIGLTGPLVMPPTTAVLLNSVPTRRAGTASGVFNTGRQVSGALAITVFGSLLSAPAGFQHGLQISLVITAATAIITAATAALLSARRPEKS